MNQGDLVVGADDNETGASIQGNNDIPQLEKISDREIFFSWINKKTNEVFYITNSGGVFQAKNGDDVALSEQNIGSVSYAEQNSTGEKIVAFLNDDGVKKAGLFDVIDKTWAPLSANTSFLTWGAQEKKLWGFLDDGVGRSFVEVNIEKNPAEYKTLYKNFSINNVVPFVTQSGRIFFSEKASWFYSPRIWEFSPKNQTLSLVIQGEKGGVFGLSQNKEYVFSLLPNSKTLSITKNDLKTSFSSGFFTIPEKCDVFASTTYCFVPQEQKNTQSFFYDYSLRKILTNDTFMSFDFSSKEVGVPISARAIPYKTDADHVFVWDNYVYFKNRYDGFLYKLGIE